MSFVFNALNTVVAAAQAATAAVSNFFSGLFTRAAGVASAVTEVVPVSSILINLVLIALVVAAFKFTTFGVVVAILAGLYFIVEIAIGLFCYAVVKAVGSAFAEPSMYGAAY